ncbi:MAG: hypothetical protein IT332_07660 [Ardenticatenales bacterium]|nr:hypothetical protein [Ardenticatenales bacterium]
MEKHIETLRRLRGRVAWGCWAFSGTLAQLGDFDVAMILWLIGTILFLWVVWDFWIDYQKLYSVVVLVADVLATIYVAFLYFDKDKLTRWYTAIPGDVGKILDALTLWLLSVPASTWTVVGVVILWRVVVSARENRARVMMSRLATDGQDVEKGVLDFKVDFQDASSMLSRQLTAITREQVAFTKMIGRRTAAMGRVRDDARRARAAATRTATRIDGFSFRVEPRAEAFSQLAGIMVDSATKWVQWLGKHADDGGDKSSSEVRDMIVPLMKNTGGAKTSMGGFRESVANVRKNNISQDLNRACDRLVVLLSTFVTTMANMEHRWGGVLQIIDTAEKARNGPTKKR